MNDEAIQQAIRDWAPELDLKTVRAFVAEHDKPDDELDSHEVWAVKLLRQRREGQHGDGASLTTVSDVMRHLDERS